MTRYRSVVVEEGGRLNNYAIEPEMYVDSTPAWASPNMQSA